MSAEIFASQVRITATQGCAEFSRDPRISAELQHPNWLQLTIRCVDFG